MKALFTSLIYCCFAIVLSAQWQQNFDDPTSFTSPPWRGDMEDFAISKKRLQLQSDKQASSNQSRIAISIPYAKEMTWMGDVHLDFLPDTSNKLYIHLYCYGSPVANTFDYISLRFGSTAHTVDLVRLRLKVNSSGTATISNETILISGKDYPFEWMVDLRYTVQYKQGEGWKFWANFGAQSMHQTLLLGSTPFDELAPYEWGGIGIDCRYSKGNASAFSFDNLFLYESLVNPDEGTHGAESLMNPEQGRPVLNELMANPLQEGSEYIELYNPSEKALALCDYAVSLRREGKLVKPIRLACSIDSLMPGQYLVLARDANAVEVQYPHAGLVLDLPRLPQLANAGFYLVLLSLAEASELEEVHYHPSMLGPGNASRRGVALERKDPKASASLLSNWGGGLEEAGYATPAYLNSIASYSDSTGQSIIPSDVDVQEGADAFDNPNELTAYALANRSEVEGSFIYSLQGNLIAWYDAAATIEWCRLFAEKAYSMKSLFGLRTDYYLVVIRFRSSESYISNRRFLLKI